jgi:NCS2 family nucleobase:cation symporter-2
MYVGAITVPIIIARSLHLTAEPTAYLISSDLFACGLATLIQCLGLFSGPFGIGVRLPVVMGVTFVAIGPSIAIGTDPALGLPGIFGATLISGVLGLLIAPFFSRLSAVFPPIVNGTVLVLIGLSLFGTAITWVSGGRANSPGDPASMGIAWLVILTILAVVRFGRGFLSNMAVLVGILVGYSVSMWLGWIDFRGVAGANWVAVVSPFHFGLPKFDLMAVVSMTVVMLITMVETSGMMLSLSRIVDRPMTRYDLTRGLRGDAAGTLLGGLFNSLPYVSYSQNIAMVRMTGVRSRFVCVGAGVILIILACIPKLSFLVTSVPLPVLGGAALVVFGMVAATGVAVLARAVIEGNRGNLYVIGIPLSIGQIPVLAPRFFEKMPHSLSIFLNNGVLLGIFAAIALNLLINGIANPDH